MVSQQHLSCWATGFYGLRWFSVELVYAIAKSNDTFLTFDRMLCTQRAMLKAWQNNIHDQKYSSATDNVWTMEQQRSILMMAKGDEGSVRFKSVNLCHLVQQSLRKGSSCCLQGVWSSNGNKNYPVWLSREVHLNKQDSGAVNHETIFRCVCSQWYPTILQLWTGVLY